MESLHPMMVHLPLAMLPAAFAVDLLAILWKRPEWHRVSLWNHGFGVFGAAAAVLTGHWAEAVAKHTYEIHQIMQTHKQLNHAVLALAAISFGWRMLKRDELSAISRKGCVLLLAAACGLMAWSAHLGGVLVYEHGVGGIYGKTAGGIQVIR